MKDDDELKDSGFSGSHSAGHGWTLAERSKQARALQSAEKSKQSQRSRVLFIFRSIMNKNIKAVTNKQTFHGDRQLPSVTWATFSLGQIPLHIAKWQAACARLMEICNCKTHKLGAQHAAEEQIAVIPFSHQAVRHACPWYLEINIGVHSAWPAAHLLRQALSYTHMHAGAKTALCALSKCELWYMAWQFVFKWCQQIQ